MKKIRYLLPLACFGLLLSSCGSDGIPLNYREGDLDIDTEWEDYNIPATGVVFAEEEQHVYIEKGSTYTYEDYYVSPKGATGASLIWTSNNTNIATVEDGVVTAISGGKTTITVSDENHNFDPVTLIVEVTKQITDFTVYAPALHTDLELDWNHQYQFTYSLTPEDTTYTDLIWSIPVEEQAIAKVENGLVTTYAKDGDVHLTVKSPKLEKEEKFTLVIRDREIHVESIALTIDSDRVEMGNTAQLSATVTPANADDAGDVKYLSSDPSIASIDISTGLVNAIAPGTVELWANADGVDSNKVEFEVYEVYATALSIDKSHDYIVTNDVDGSRSLTVNIETSEPGASKPTNATIKYTSNDPSVVSVDDNGMMTAHKSGTAIITASIKGQGLNFYEDSVTVTSKAYITKVSISGPTSSYITDPVTPVVLTASVEPNPHEEDEIIWSVNPEEKVTKEVDGEQITLTPLAAGPVTVTATSTHTGASATHTVSFNIKNADFTLVGDFNNWTAGDQAYALKKIEDNHYQIKGVNLIKGCAVKVVDELKTNWYANASEYPNCGYTLIDDGYGGKNMSLDHTGEYTIDFYPESEYGNHIVFTLDVPGEDPVVEIHYYLVGDFNSWTQLDENYKFTALTENHYRLTDVKLETGKAIKVMDNALPKHNWFANASDGWEGCEYVLVDDGYGGKNVEVIVGGTYTIDFYVESEYGNHIIFHSGEVPPEPEYEHNWYLEGSITNWSLDENVYFSKDATDATGNHYYIADVELAEGDEIKAYNPNSDSWLGTTGSGAWWTAGTEGDHKENLIVSEAGTYYINLYVNDTEGHHLTLWKDTSVPEYTATIIADLSVFNSWDKPVSKVSLYVWTEDGTQPLGTWSEVENNLASGSVSFTSTKPVTHFILYLYQTIDSELVIKQTINLDCNIYETSNYTLDLSDIKWTDTEPYQMYNITITKGGDTPTPPPTPTVSYYLKGTFNSWSEDDNYKFSSTSDTNKYTLEGVTITAGDKLQGFKADGGDGVWYTNDHAYEECGFTLDGNDIVVSASGVYTVDLYVNSDDGNHIVLTKTSGGDTPVDPPVVTEKVISIAASVAQTDGAWIALWAFKSGSDGKFYFADTSGYENDGTWIFTLPSDIDTIIVLRMAAGAEVTDVTKWPEGKVWNQTGNIAIAGTVYTLTSIMQGSWTA